MIARRKVLWISDGPAPANVCRATENRWQLERFSETDPLGPQLGDAGVAIVCPSGLESDSSHMSALLEELNATATVTVLLIPEGVKGLSLEKVGKYICVERDVSPEELAAKLSAAWALQEVICDLRLELSAARDVATGAARTVGEVDEEMRLAAKLQRDFLPSQLPEVGPVRFGALFRPASWVSGDIYDVIRLDETHVGFYVIDAVGHGMPAALLTMFIKKAIQTKRIVGNSYQIVPPHVAMTELNTDICNQNLSSCHFCTGVYCIIDTESLEMTYCRAGHPAPIVIHADGRMEQIDAPGSLLGVFPEEKYHSQQLRFGRGDRMILFTDGLEDVLCGVGRDKRQTISQVVAPWVGMAREELFLNLTAAIDEASDETPPRDDITAVVMDVIK